MLTYPFKDCPWVVRHKVDGDKHLAWRMRAFMLGDFLKRRPARSDFIITRDDLPADWTKRPKCVTCGVVPETEDLIVIERATGADYFLDYARDEKRAAKVWATTKDDRCRWCQDPMASINEDRLCPKCQAIADEPAPPPRNTKSGGTIPWPPPPVCTEPAPPVEE